MNLPEQGTEAGLVAHAQHQQLGNSAGSKQASTAAQSEEQLLRARPAQQAEQPEPRLVPPAECTRLWELFLFFICNRLSGLTCL